MMIRTLIAFLAAVGLMAQEELPERTFRTTVSEVVVPVTVTNRAGSFVSALEAKDFRLYDNEKLQEIDVDLTASPVSMVVAVQRSASVEGMLPHMKKIGNMIEANVIGEFGEAMLLAFDHRMRVLQEWTNDGAKFTDALDRMMVGSNTSAMIDAVFFATRELRKRPADHRRILLMITETRDKGSEGRLRDALIEAEMHNVIIYTVNINRGVAMWKKEPGYRQSSPYPVAATTPLPGGGGVAPVTPHMNEQLRGQQSMTFVPMVKEIFIQTKAIFVPNKAEVFTRYTGGREFSFVNLKSLERALMNVGEELHSQYILTYQPNNPEDAGYHEISVDVNRPGLNVRAREGYWSAAKYTEGSEN